MTFCASINQNINLLITTQWCKCRCQAASGAIWW